VGVVKIDPVTVIFWLEALTNFWLLFTCFVEPDHNSTQGTSTKIYWVLCVSWQHAYRKPCLPQEHKENCIRTFHLAKMSCDIWPFGERFPALHCKRYTVCLNTERNWVLLSLSLSRWEAMWESFSYHSFYSIFENKKKNSNLLKELRKSFSVWCYRINVSLYRVIQK